MFKRDRDFCYFDPPTQGVGNHADQARVGSVPLNRISEVDIRTWYTTTYLYHARQADHCLHPHPGEAGNRTHAG